MTILDPMARYWNTPEQYEMLRRFVGEPDITEEIQELKSRIERMEQFIIRKVWERIDKELTKNIESVIAKEVIKQINKEMKKGKITSK